MRSLSIFRSPLHATVLAAIALVLIPKFSIGAKNAAIQLPDGFVAASTRVAFSGFGGYNRGHYNGGEFRGEFVRTESRLGVFDPLYVSNKARSGFTLQRLDGDTEISAECRAVERTATIKAVTLDLKKLTYSCEFSGAAAVGEMRFVLGEPKPQGLKERLLARDRRTGEAAMFGHEFIVNSVHDYQGSKLGSQVPLGYFLESDGSTVAAVDLLDWNPIVHIRDDLTESQRTATMIVALSLAVLRDPANSTLEDL